MIQSIEFMYFLKVLQLVLIDVILNNKHIQLMKDQVGEVRKSPTKKQKVYYFCKNLIAVIITLVALIPIVYLLGSDDFVYPNRPLFSAYTEDPYFQNKINEVESSLNGSLIVNLHLQAGEKREGSVRDWQHLQQFVRYLGNHFNNHQLTTVNRIIVPPEVKQPKKGKSSHSTQNQRLIERAYSLANSGDLNTIKNKLNKVALSTINRLKIKQKQPKNNGIAEIIRSRVIDTVLAKKIWIITIHPDNWQYHSPQELRKQLTALSKENEKDRFIVVSLSPADPEWKRMKPISITINDSVFITIKNKVKEIVKSSLPFEVNATRLLQTVLCHYETSLYQLNNFLQNCNNTFSCHNSIRLLSKKPKKDDNSQSSLLNELCSTGHIDEQNDEFKTVLNDLGFFSEQEEAEESIKLYYQIANGKKCKGSKRCTYEWLKDEQKTQPIKNNQTDKIPQVVPKPQTNVKNKTKEAKVESSDQKDQTAAQNITQILKGKTGNKFEVKISKEKSNEDKKQSSSKTGKSVDNSKQTTKASKGKEPKSKISSAQDALSNDKTSSSPKGTSKPSESQKKNKQVSSQKSNKKKGKQEAAEPLVKAVDDVQPTKIEDEKPVQIQEPNVVLSPDIVEQVESEKINQKQEKNSVEDNHSDATESEALLSTEQTQSQISSEDIPPQSDTKSSANDAEKTIITQEIKSASETSIEKSIQPIESCQKGENQVCEKIKEAEIQQKNTKEQINSQDQEQQHSKSEIDISEAKEQQEDVNEQEQTLKEQENLDNEQSQQTDKQNQEEKQPKQQLSQHEEITQQSIQANNTDTTSESDESSESIPHQTETPTQPAQESPEASNAQISADSLEQTHE